ncbi:hypothetical protein D6C77_01035 [Aureobasidium pullulans]|nr:hypothetical protein D6C77_01035 [Aureobasidium pullulans]
MKNLSTTKALERLFWTSPQPSLAPWISSITVDFHNKHLLLSNVLKATDVPGIVDFHIKDDAPLISPCFVGHMNIFHRLYSLEMEDCSICDYDLEPMLTDPNLKHLRLHDVDLSPYTGKYRAHLPDRWPKMLGLVASTTDLQSCQISGLADWDNALFLSELWEAEAKDGKTVSEALLQRIKIRRPWC